ncbi:glycosyltransferase family 2 protein [Mariniflexile sp.]|uniref:glycosyltransferase family 2 protein n=1 Tax=Mariniflexile sp. TaxID=1979402 RepID=UPI00356ABC4E
MERKKERISFLITHYNRPQDLLACINAIKNIDLPEYEIVVSDDGSSLENINILKSYGIDRIVLAEKNQGLAANINKGIQVCNGEYIIYCQEDFALVKELKSILLECMELLDNNTVDLIRFSSYFKFNKLKRITDNISRIPKFSFHNFLQNYYQYSDHPFITKKSFYNNYGYYLENTSGRFGETEYAIRILSSKAKIAITNKNFATQVVGSQSVLINEEGTNHKNYNVNKKIVQIARAFRLYFECVFYNKNKRGLITYKNGRNKK